MKRERTNLYQFDVDSIVAFRVIVKSYAGDAREDAIEVAQSINGKIARVAAEPKRIYKIPQDAKEVAWNNFTPWAWTLPKAV